MAKDTSSKVKAVSCSGPMGFVLLMAYFGALIYFFHQAHGFGMFMSAFFKAAAWPAILVYHAMQLLHV